MNERDKSVISAVVFDSANDISAACNTAAAYTGELANLLLRELGYDARELYIYGQPERDAADHIAAAVREILCPGIDVGFIFTEFCRCFTALYYKKFGAVEREFIFPRQSEPKEIAAYVSGGASDEAYEIFARRHSLKAIRSERTQSICDEVFDGGAGYCILPIKNSTDGRLFSFYRMINVYDLKIVAVSDVAAGDMTMRFALCTRSVRPFSRSPACMELTIGVVPGVIFEIADAARRFGHSIYDISTSPGGSGDVMCSFSFMLGGDYRPFLLYMNLFRPRFTLTGLYDVDT